MRLKVGTKVILKKHALDSAQNLKIGVVGVIEDNGGRSYRPYCVIWDESEIADTWWVAGECIRPYKIVLENK